MATRGDPMEALQVLRATVAGPHWTPPIWPVAPAEVFKTAWMVGMEQRIEALEREIQALKS